MNTPKVVSGIDAASLAKVQHFYDQIVDTTVPVSSPKEAELTKLLENTFRHVNIALVNELAMFAADLGIDVWEAIDAASTKPFGYMRFTPGPGVGGHCLPVDPSYLSWQVKRRLGQSFRFVELANDVNEHMPDYVVRRLFSALNEQGKAIKGSRILLLGVSFKANVGDWRESPTPPGGAAPRRPRRRPRGRRSLTCRPTASRPAPPRWRPPPRSCGAPTPSCCSSTTTPSTPTSSSPTPATCSTPRPPCPTPTTSNASSDSRSV